MSTLSDFYYSKNGWITRNGFVWKYFNHNIDINNLYLNKKIEDKIINSFERDLESILNTIFSNYISSDIRIYRILTLSGYDRMKKKTIQTLSLKISTKNIKVQRVHKYEYSEFIYDLYSVIRRERTIFNSNQKYFLRKVFVEEGLDLKHVSKSLNSLRITDFFISLYRKLKNKIYGA